MVTKTELFQGDCLERKEFASAIKFFIKAISKEGGAIAIHANSGMGKTWFCDRFSKYLENDEENFEAPVKIDAFFEDYHGDPFWTIAKKFNDRFSKSHKQKGKEFIKKIIKFSLPLTKLIDGGLIAHEMIEKTISKYLEEPDPKTLIDEYKKLLGDSVQEGKTLVVLIDELDRCRPDFAVNLIEKIKHYFEIPKIVFVLMINSQQNYEHFKKIYGQGIDAQGYLEKFLKLPLFHLPEKHNNDLGFKTRPENHFTYKIYEHFFREKYNSFLKEGVSHMCLKKLAAFSHAMNLSYREQEKATLMIALLPQENLLKNGLLSYAAHFIPLSLKRPDLMNKVLRGEEYKEMKIFLDAIKPSYYEYGNNAFFEQCTKIYQYSLVEGNREEYFKDPSLITFLSSFKDLKNAPKYLAQMFTTPNF